MQVLDRGEKIELLVDKTENLRSQVSLAQLVDCLFSSWAAGIHFFLLSEVNFFQNVWCYLCFWIDVLVLVQAQDFRQQGTKMRRKMWIQNMKIKLIVLGIIIALILIIVLSVCHGFKCWFGLGKSMETGLCCHADMVDLVNWLHLLILAYLSLFFSPSLFSSIFFPSFRSSFLFWPLGKGMSLYLLNCLYRLYAWTPRNR